MILFNFITLHKIIFLFTSESSKCPQQIIHFQHYLDQFAVSEILLQFQALKYFLFAYRKKI